MLQRVRSLAQEALKFGVVGGIGFIIDVTVFNLLRYAGDPGMLEHKPLTAKGLSVAVATVFTYLGNRHWTWHDRARTGARREVTLFFVLNGVGMVIALACLATSHYVLDQRSPLADNISANVVGLFFGMLFRFWSYRTFVFKPAVVVAGTGRPPGEPSSGHDPSEPTIGPEPGEPIGPEPGEPIGPEPGEPAIGPEPGEPAIGREPSPHDTTSIST